MDQLNVTSTNEMTINTEFPTTEMFDDMITAQRDHEEAADPPPLGTDTNVKEPSPSADPPPKGGDKDVKKPSLPLTPPPMNERKDSS